jgi:PPK2 family polyphosphate:nucleotide phosphotransferase
MAKNGSKKALGIDISDFRVPEDERARLDRRKTLIDPFHKSKDEYEDALAADCKRLKKLQEAQFAAGSEAVLVVLQAPDAAGKDGLIEHVLSAINAQGCHVTSYKAPSPEEAAHDFLWRTARNLPQRGYVGVFNRSYYEEVLVVRVHPQFLAAQKLSTEPKDLPALWKSRFKSIRDHEDHLVRNGTRVVKIYLHMSQAEQRKRFTDRVNDPEKNWKASAGDIAESEHWAEYREAYEDAISATSTRQAPWYVVPADDKETSRLIVARILVELFETMDPQYPKLDPKVLADLKTRLNA